MTPTINIPPLTRSSRSLVERAMEDKNLKTTPRKRRIRKLFGEQDDGCLDLIGEHGLKPRPAETRSIGSLSVDRAVAGHDKPFPSPRSYTVIYRMGGPALCNWKRCIPVPTLQKARTMANGIERMGYKTLVWGTQNLNSVGLPVGWCSKCDALTGECTKRAGCEGD